MRVDSCVRTMPIRGSFTCRRSESMMPIAPVVNRHDNVLRLPLNFGKPSLRPRRSPASEFCQFVSAAARLAKPDE